MPKELVRDLGAKLPTRGSLSHSSQQFLIQMYHLKNNNNVTRDIRNSVQNLGKTGKNMKLIEIKHLLPRPIVKTILEKYLD